MFLMLMAQTADISSTAAWIPTMGAVASTGFTVWYAYYTITQTIPNLMKDHRQERDEWKKEWRESTDRHSQTMNALTLATNELQNAVRELLARNGSKND